MNQLGLQSLRLSLRLLHRPAPLQLHCLGILNLHAYDLNDSELTVWVYKRTAAAGVPTFRGRWVQTTPELAAALRQAVNDARATITEIIEYDILAQNNEGSALGIGADETYIGLVAAQAQNPIPARKVRNLKQIANADFYVVRFASDSGVLMAVRKTDRSWSTRRTKGLMKVVYSDDALDIDERPSFNIDAFFDFFALDDSIFIASTRSAATRWMACAPIAGSRLNEAERLQRGACRARIDEP